MIIFFVSGEIIFLAIILFAAFLSGTFEYIMGILNTLRVIFLVISFIETVIIGFFRNKKTVKNTVLQLSVDYARNFLFFSTINNIGIQIGSEHGLAGIFSACVFVLYFGCLLIPFLLGELYTFLCMDTKGKWFFGSILWLVVVAIGAGIGYIL